MRDGLFRKADAVRWLIRRTHGPDPDEVRHLAAMSVWVRWFVCAAAVVGIVYRTPPMYAVLAALLLAFGALNGVLHQRLITNRPVTRHQLLGIGAVDIIIITAAVVAHGGFVSFIFLAYYPALGTIALIGSSTVAFVWVTFVAAVYTGVCLTVGSGLDLAARDEKDLFWRIVVAYTVVASIRMIARFERLLRREAVQRALQRERVELSQTIHDTTAQTAYMIGLGIDTAMELANGSDEKLAATLAATSDLSKSVMWDLRGPIHIGHIMGGRELGQVLRSHAAIFTTITSVPAEMAQSGTEPPLTTETRTQLFAIAHNALTNAFRHARASRVDLRLHFTAERVELSISDDGVGLPDGYAERGNGFRSMQGDAEAMGGKLIVTTGRREGGTTVTCVVPYRSTG